MLWIDPQLANNQELEKCLVAWEEAWELGNTFLVQEETRKHPAYAAYARDERIHSKGTCFSPTLDTQIYHKIVLYGTICRLISIIYKLQDSARSYKKSKETRNAFCGISADLANIQELGKN